MRFPWFSGVITALILVAMLTPAESIPKVGVSGADVVVHTVTFAVWAFVVRRETAASPVTVFIVGMVLAVGTELLQILVPGRMFAYWDILLDVFGLGVGLALASFLASRRGQDNSAKSARAAGESQANAN